MPACIPTKGETQLNYSGPKPPYEHLDTSASYSWLKSPRWKSHAMEVGPLARVLMLYASGHEPTRDLAHKALTQLDLPLEAMFSTLGRTAARTLECKIFADTLPQWYGKPHGEHPRGRCADFQPGAVGALDLAAACTGRGVSPRRRVVRSRTGS